jgi:hypothetical protein
LRLGLDRFAIERGCLVRMTVLQHLRSLSGFGLAQSQLDCGLLLVLEELELRLGLRGLTECAQDLGQVKMTLRLGGIESHGLFQLLARSLILAEMRERNAEVEASVIMMGIDGYGSLQMPGCGRKLMLIVLDYAREIKRVEVVRMLVQKPLCNWFGVGIVILEDKHAQVEKPDCGIVGMQVCGRAQQVGRILISMRLDIDGGQCGAQARIPRRLCHRCIQCVDCLVELVGLGIGKRQVQSQAFVGRSRAQ